MPTATSGVSGIERTFARALLDSSSARHAWPGAGVRLLFADAAWVKHCAVSPGVPDELVAEVGKGIANN